MLVLYRLFNEPKETQEYPKVFLEFNTLDKCNKKLDNLRCLTIFLVLVAPILTFITYGTLNDLNIYPPINYGFQTIEIHKSKSSIELTDAFKDLQRVKEHLANVENLPMSEVKSLLTETVEVSQNIENLVNEQVEEQKAIIEYLKEQSESATASAKKEIESLKNQVETAKINAKEARQKAEDIGAITDEQKNLLIQELTKSATESFWLGVLVSLPVGVFVSLATAIIVMIFEPNFQQLKQYFQQLKQYFQQS